MKKLDLMDLQVESFHTTEVPQTAGTVYAHEETPVYACNGGSRVPQQSCGTCTIDFSGCVTHCSQPSCFQTCLESCPATCPISCVVSGCVGNCTGGGGNISAAQSCAGCGGGGGTETSVYPCGTGGGNTA